MTDDALRAPERFTTGDEDGADIVRALLGKPPGAPVTLGFLATPNALAEVFRTRLPPVHRLILTEIARDANYRAQPQVRPLQNGGTATLHVGEALVCRRSFAEKHRLGKGEKGRSVVRRALRNAERLGIISMRPAGDKSGPRSDPPRAPRGDPPPTIVRFNVLRRVTWPAENSDLPPSPPQSSTATRSNLINLETCEPDASAYTCGERSKKLALPACVKDLKARLENGIGRQLWMPTDAAERREVIDELEPWIEADGIDTVEAACLAKARRMALRGEEASSMLLFARYSDEISDAVTREVPSFGEDERNPEWRRVKNLMNPAQYVSLKDEAAALWARFPGEKVETDEAQRAWRSLRERCEREVGIR